MFDEAGAFAGFDASEPTSADGGKPKVIGMLKEQHGYEQAIMVGDGMTDFEAFEAGAADRFIGFGVLAKRAVVVAACELPGASDVRTVGGLAKALGV